LQYFVTQFDYANNTVSLALSPLGVASGVVYEKETGELSLFADVLIGTGSLIVLAAIALGMCWFIKKRKAKPHVNNTMAEVIYSQPVNSETMITDDQQQT
jgi:ABC-type uncharacterized transport system permease subunit